MNKLRMKAAKVLRDFKSLSKAPKEIFTNRMAAIQSNKKSKANIYLLAVHKAKKQYKQNTGLEMTPSKLKSEFTGGFISKPIQQYISNRDKYNKELRKKYKL